MQSPEFSKALELSRAGEFRAAALQLARLPAGLEQDQARVYLLHHAGDLSGALQACKQGLEHFPADTYLATTRQELGLALSRAGEVNADGGGPGSRLLESQEQLAASLGRAQVVCGLAGLILVALLLAALLGPASARAGK